jgi:hypothetical protein
MNITVFWDLACRSPAEMTLHAEEHAVFIFMIAVQVCQKQQQAFGGKRALLVACFLLFPWLIYDATDGDSRLFRLIGGLLPDYTMLHSRSFYRLVFTKI